MSVHRVGEDLEYGVPTGTKCFYCYGLITDYAVCWMGLTDIWMHPQCVIELTLRLHRDVWAIECKTHTNVTGGGD